MNCINGMIKWDITYNCNLRCILYLISEGEVYSNIIQILQEWFELSKEKVEEFFSMFISGFPMKALIVPNLIRLEVPLSVFASKE